MTTVNIHEAKAHLSRLVDRAVNGEAFIIAKAGRPLVKVVALDLPEVPQPVQRLGFMSFSVPDDFDRLGQAHIEERFGGGS